MEKGRLLIGFFIFVLLIGIIQASTLKVNVLTLENHKLEIQFLNPDRMNSQPISYGKYLNNTGDGDFSFEFESDADEYELSIFLMDGNEKVLHEEFEGVSSDQEIQLLLLPGMSEITEDYEESTTSVSDDSENQSSANETAQNESETNSANETENTSLSSESENETAPSSKLGGFAVVNQALNIFTNKVFYYVGLVVILGLVGFMVARRVYKKGTFKFKLPKKKNSDTGTSRGKERIEEAKKKLVEDEKELMKLRKEEKDKEN